MFKFFDRYIIKEIIPPFFIGLLIYAFVLLMNQVFLLSELFIAKGVALRVVAQIFLYLIPSVLAFAVPMAVLMGILAGLSRLSTDSEVVAFKSLGISNLRLLRPVLVFALGGWLVTSYLSLYLAPRFNHKWVLTLTRSVLTKVQLRINPREFNESIPNVVLFIQDITQENRWKNIFVHLSRPGEEPRAIFAQTGRLNFFPEIKRATLELVEGSIHSVPPANPGRYSVTFFDRIEEEISIETLFAQFSSQKRVREKDIGELLKEVEKIGERRIEIEGDKTKLGALPEAVAEARRKDIEYRLWQNDREWRSHWVEIHKKFALPFVCFIFVLMGIPLGMSTKKGGRTSGFTISLGIILVYYILITAGEKLAMDGLLSPFFGMWGPNLVFLVAAVYLFARSSKEYLLFSLFSRFRRKKSAKTILIRVRVSRRGWKLLSLRRPRLSLRFPNILDRYIMRKYLAIFTLVFLGLLSISIIVTFFERIDNVYEHNKSLALFVTYIQYRIPEFSHYILPVTTLTATLLALGLMTKFNEITAMKACGVSLYRLILSIVFLAAVVSIFSFALQETLLPSANKKAEETWNRINDIPPRTYNFLDRRWVLGKDKNRIFHYRYYDPIANVFSQISVYDLDLDTWTLRRRIFAEKGRIEGNNLWFIRGWSRNFSDEMTTWVEAFKEMDLRVAEEAGYFVKEWEEPSFMSYAELKTYIADIEEMGFEATRFRVDLSAKLSFPFVSLVMAFIAIPFAFSMGKKGALVGIGLSIGIAMIYWGALGVFKSLGYVGFLSAFLASWGPNLVFAATGLYLLLRLRT
ncbi:MAG: LPS export ABC transporter permease LptF [Clostridiales bacterium]|nr:LPS export ABC transporter permease LptF [Clostridiales bacterium]